MRTAAVRSRTALLKPQPSPVLRSGRMSYCMPVVASAARQRAGSLRARESL
jgi:hypothetical protein